LSVVHDAGLMHRDLKPENLFITRRATGEDWCKVLDFGVAKMEASLTTAQGAVVGTVRYMAPEQLSDGASVGPTTDVYALGAILYECLSGKAPYDGSSVQELMYKIMNEPVPELETELLPERLRDIVSACLTRQQRSRPQSAATLAKRLQECVQARAGGVGFETLAEASQILPANAPAKPRTQRGVAAAGVAFALTVGILGAVSHFGQAGSLPDADGTKTPVRPPPKLSVQPPAESATAVVAAAAPPESVAKPDAPAEPARRRAPNAAASRTPLNAAAPPAHTAAAREHEPPSQSSAGGPSPGRFDPANPYAE
jgi:serine/threonine-protein kinase